MSKVKKEVVDDAVITELVRGKKLLQLDPVEISADPKYNGRFTVPSKVDIREMAGSIRKMGQIHPILVTKISNTDDYRVAIGFTRHAAFVWLNENLADGETPYTVEAVEISGGDAAKLLELNVEENVRRKNLSPMDRAHTIQMLDEQGKTNAQIAAIMGFKSHASVIQYRSLLSLAASIQKRVHVGEIPADEAFGLAKLDAGEQAEVVTEVAPTESPVDEKTGKATKKTAPGAVKRAVEKKTGFAAGIRKLPELRKLIASVRNDATMPSGASYICAMFLMFVEKSKNEGHVIKAFRDFCSEDEEARKFLMKKDLYSKTKEEKDAEAARAKEVLAEEKAAKKAAADKAKAKAAKKKAA